MTLSPDLDAERRARLLAEKRLEQTKSELYAANQKIARHARTLSDQIVATREAASHAKEEAEAWRDDYTVAKEDLARAESAIELAEKRLWASVEAIRDGFAVFDDERKLVAANPAFLAIFEGLEDVRPGCDHDAMLDLMVEEGIVDPGTQSARDWLAMMRARWDAERIEPVVLRLWNDQYFRLTERRTRSGDVVMLALNITDQIAREAQMREARDKAEAASRAKSAFLANMSHEIRTPMNGVVGMVDLLSDTDLTDEQRSYIDTIRSSGEALLAIINDILDYSKIEADRIELKSKPFDLERCIHDVVTLLQPGAADKGLELVVDYDLFMPTSFSGDAGRIRQVLTNLVGNAIKFTEEGHVTIRVVGLPGDSDRGYRVHVTVEDTGIGIPEDQLDGIFGEFNQVENEMSRAHDGTGLGLAISKKLIRLMGGEIWVDSTIGQGSGFGFHLTLPALEDADPDAARAPGWLKRALVLDGGGAAHAVLAKQLTLLGLKTQTVQTADALFELQPGARDIVLVDPGMPDDVGGLLSRLRQACPPGGVFLLTSGPGRSDGWDVDGMLSRPVLRSDLVRAVGDLVPPLSDALDETLSDAEEAAVVPEADGPRALRVLAAEDNRTNRFVFQKMLTGLDIELEFAENGLEAVQLYRSFRPDIVFTDISMPQMDGKEASKRIRGIEEEGGLDRCPIVAITAHAMEGDADDILAAGIDTYLSKPLKKQAIIEQILTAQPLNTRPVMPVQDTVEPVPAMQAAGEVDPARVAG